jgi:hypothetical protein
MRRFKLSLCNPVRSEVWCPECVGYLVHGDGMEKALPEGSQDFLPLGDVLQIEPLFGSEAPCAWCSPAPPRWLSERMIARLSPLRRANLERHLTERAEFYDAAKVASGISDAQRTEYETRSQRADRVLGRACAIITNLDAREREAASHG